MNESENSEDVGDQEDDRQFFATHLADFIRILLREISSDYDTGLHSAERMEILSKMASQFGSNLTWHHLFDDAFKKIRSNFGGPMNEDPLIHVSKKAIKYFVECSSEDVAAQARIARSRRNFSESMAYLSDSGR